MSADIGKDDAVLCVEEDYSEDRRYRISVGRVYFVEEVIPLVWDHGPCTKHGDACTKGGLTLQGVEAPEEMMWCLDCFVKAGRRGDFDHLLACEPVEQLEDA